VLWAEDGYWNGIATILQNAKVQCPGWMLLVSWEPSRIINCSLPSLDNGYSRYGFESSGTEVSGIAVEVI
jgi:hypothetical protein